MAKSKEVGYQVAITHHSSEGASGNFNIVADLPEQFVLSASSAYESVDQAFGVGSLLPGKLGDAAGTFNLSTQSQLLSHAVWRGTGPIEFGLQLIFDAETNNFSDVKRSLDQLLSLTLPGKGGVSGMLDPPIPGTGRPDYNRTEVRIGRQYRFGSVVVQSASLTSESRLNFGFPIAGAIELQCRTIMTLGKEDWKIASGGGVDGNGGTFVGGGF